MRLAYGAPRPAVFITSEPRVLRSSTGLHRRPGCACSTKSNKPYTHMDSTGTDGFDSPGHGRRTYVARPTTSRRPSKPLKGGTSSRSRSSERDRRRPCCARSLAYLEELARGPRASEDRCRPLRTSSPCRRRSSVPSAGPCPGHFAVPAAAATVDAASTSDFGRSGIPIESRPGGTQPGTAATSRHGPFQGLDHHDQRTFVRLRRHLTEVPAGAELRRRRPAMAARRDSELVASSFALRRIDMRDGLRRRRQGLCAW